MTVSLAKGGVDLAFAQFDAEQAPAWIEAVSSWTTATERRVAHGRADVLGTAQYLVGRAALRLLIAGEAAKALEISLDRDGKPFLPSRPGLHVSISHCPGYVASVVCDAAPAGVDVEVPSGTDQEALAIAARMFDDSEAKLLSEAPPARQVNDFWRYWTCKEAAGKAGGVGLARALGTAVVDLSPEQPRLRSVGFGPPAEQWSLFHSRLDRIEVGDRADGRDRSVGRSSPEVICAVAVASAGVWPGSPRPLQLGDFL